MNFTNRFAAEYIIMQNKSYSQIRAMLAITRYSLKAIFRSPSAVIFSIGFPLIFILIFGFVGGSGKMLFHVAFDSKSDTNNVFYHVVKDNIGLQIEQYDNVAKLNKDLEKGDITAVLSIVENKTVTGPRYYIHIKSSEAVNQQNLQLLRVILNSVVSKFNEKPVNEKMVELSEETETIPGRTYRTIDFILPGQLGFSLLSAGVFGVAFLFFNLRQQLVLKRFYATPIQRPYIVLGEAFSRVIFQIITAVIIIGLGHFAFHFTLVHGFITFLDIMVLSFVALILFMGFGFIVSNFAKNESTIPPFANLFTLPQFLLAGTFFPVETFPKWLQPLCNILPLTHFNNAMRNISFEGVSLFSCWKEFGIMGIWIVIVYTIAIKTFKWE